MKHTTMTVRTILLSIVLLGIIFATACSWEIFDPLNQPTNMFDGTYTFEDSWWDGKITIESYTDAKANEISAFWMEKEVDSPVLIYFHGIGGNLGTYAAHIRFLYTDTSFSVFAIDYPASGMSRGNRSEEDLYAAARGALAWVTAETNLTNDQIVVYGFSLGAALAIKLGTENPTLPVVSDGGFTSYGDWMPTISHMNFVLPGENKFDNLTHIKDVGGPKLFIHGTNDRQNPFWMGEALYESAEGDKTFIEIEAAGHMFNSQHAIESPVAYALIKEELEKLVVNP